MYTTYIYGTPLGFDFYEDVASLKDYFKAFYISSRRGSRLMVNRRADGVTFYNYVHYGLVENGNRQNSFFGMTLAMDGGEYAGNFKEMFDWFDFLFKKLVERGKLFFVNDGGCVQYKVAPFNLADEEVEWLKSNIPNIFQQPGELGLSHYDSSFQALTSGQIRCFNDETPEPKILDAFRKYSWVAVSPSFKPEEEPIEIVPEDIEELLNDYTKRLLDIALNPQPQYMQAVKSIADDCDENIALVRKYLSTERDEGDRKVCDELVIKASDCKSRAVALMSRIDEMEKKVTPTPTPTPNPVTTPNPVPRPNPVKQRRCAKCGKNKPISSFQSVAATICIDCERIEQNRRKKVKTRRCVKCGLDKPLSHFDGSSLICDECKRDTHVAKRRTVHVNKRMFWTVFLCLIALVVLIIVRPWESSDSTPDTGIDMTDTIPANERFDQDAFNEYVYNEQFNEAYDMIDGKQDVDNYRYELKEAVIKHISSMIDDAKGLDSFWWSNTHLLNGLKIDKDYWTKCASAYQKLYTDLLKRRSFSAEQRRQANELISQLPSGCQADAQRLVNEKPNDSGVPKTDGTTHKEEGHSKPKAESQPYIKVTVDGKTTTYKKGGNLSRKKGTEILLKSNERMIIETEKKDIAPSDDRKSCAIKLERGSNIKATCGDVTIIIRGTN